MRATIDRRSGNQEKTGDPADTIPDASWGAILQGPRHRSTERLQGG
ncbi:MAG: hypothetical protein JXR76_02380 [Deltaproteobacteria bacterium]|nr:hypothetical protein [Deltaproteobacteria bacterium]